MRLAHTCYQPLSKWASVRMATAERTPWWAWAWPALAWVVLVITMFAGAPAVIAAAAGAVLIATVFAAVYHAEVSRTASASRSARSSSPWR